VLVAWPWWAVGDTDTDTDTDSDAGTDTDSDEVNLHCYDGDPFLNSLVLGRTSDLEADPVILISDLNLMEETPTEEITICESPDPAWCAENPCHDCDGDEAPECPETCCLKVLYTVQDECAPPGGYWYQSLGNPTSPFYVRSQQYIDVSDAGADECDTDSSGDAGTDGGGDTDTDDGGGCGCSVTGAGMASPLAFLLLAVGLIALAADRRRRR